MYRLKNLRLDLSLLKGKSLRNQSTESAEYFITTPIFYVNSAPHIGHLYSALLADAHYRYRRLRNPHISGIFSTGTDEHGLKIQQAASLAGVTPNDLCNSVSSKFRTLFDSCGISYTDFIRTTESRHKTVVSEIWNKLLADGHLYRDVYSSWYSVQDEAFLTSTQVEERNGAHYSLESGHKVEWASEENWCFRLSNQREHVSKWIRDTDPIQPTQFVGQVKAWLEDDRFGDLSVSRPKTRLQWGISVPRSPDPGRGTESLQSDDTIYVWLDALANYLTVAGYRPGQSSPSPWPPTVQVIGKDILKFHAIYWISFLGALDLPLPRRLLVHSHWMVNDVKMSKSLGNVLDPNELIEKYSVDGTRYMLLREGVPHTDGNFSRERMVHYLNLELADTLGNLLNRSSSKGVNPNQIVPCWEPHFKDYETTLSSSLMSAIEGLADQVSLCYENFNFYQGIVHVMDVLRTTNHFVQEEKPWELKKTDMDRLQFVLALTLESLRVSGILLSPIIPTTSLTLLSKINIKSSELTWDSTKQFVWNQTVRSPRTINPEKTVLFKKIRD